MQFVLNLFFYEVDIVNQKESVVFWRQRFYAIMMVFTVIGGLGMSIAGAIGHAYIGHLSGVLINALMYLIVVTILSFKKLNVRRREMVMAVVYYSLGIVLLVGIGPKSVWALMIVIAFVCAGFLFDVDDIKTYGVFNLIIFAIITFLLKMSYLNAFEIAKYGEGWFVNSLSVQVVGMLLLSLIHYFLVGMGEQSEIIAKSERKLLATLNAINDGVIVTDNIGNIVKVNPHMVAHYKLTKSLIVGAYVNSILEVSRVEDDQRIDDFFIYMKAFPESHMTMRVKGSEQTYFIACRQSSIVDDEGVVDGYVCMFHDLTAHKQEELNIYQSQKMEAIGTMAGGVAHDFNNMLGGILGYAELSRELISKDQGKLLRYNNEIIKTSNKASELTKQLLSYARRKEMTREPIDMNQCVLNVASLMERTFEKKIEIVTKTIHQPLMVYGDGTLLENAILNMGLNGKDAMRNGGKLVISVGRIYLDESYCKASNFDISSGTYCHLRVEDTGSGMDEAVIGRIFEPFFTTKEIGKGTGLGMAATYGTIVSHDGAIVIKSRPNIGTEVDVYLPLYITENQEETKKNIKNPIEVAHSGKILVIDDEEVIRTMIKEILEMLGYEVDVASDGYEGIELFEGQESNYRGVLVDMIMPKMSGREVYSKIKAIDPKAKVIMISGYIDDHHVDELYALGLDAFVKKPFSIESIVEALSVL